MRREMRGVIVGLGLVLTGCKAPVSANPGFGQMGPETRPAAASSQTLQRSDERTRRARPDANAAPGSFDFYLLTLSWSPEFCVTHPQAAECSAHPRFILHGLWPQNADGSYPEHCSGAPGPADPGQYRDIFPDAGLLRHEWQTHGTCSGLEPDAYFKLARQAFRSIKIPAQLSTATYPLQLQPANILADFTVVNAGLSAENLALSCGNNRLTAVEVCLSKDLHAASCSSVRTCRANVVKITPPGPLNDE